MDPKAMYSLTYGVFMVATRVGDRMNGCITNTAIQVAANPTRLALSCISTNLTTEMIRESGVFTVSILDQTCSFETIRHFGLQSGRNVDKFSGMEPPLTGNGLPYMGWSACAVMNCRVVETHDLGSHILFIAEIDDMFRTGEEEPLTYADYQNRLKPKKAEPPKATRKIIGWRCKICQYLYEGEELPKDFVCPLCGHDASDFEPVYAD